MDEATKEKIIYLREVMNLSFRQIGEQVGLQRKKVSRIYAGDSAKSNKKCALDNYRFLIAGWFHEYPRLKACQVYDWLQERQVKISYPRVVQYTKEFRKKKETVYHHLTFLPGEEGQVDWAIIIHPTLGKIYCFALILSYSRYLFAHLFPRSSFEFFIQGHLMAFDAFSGLPHSLRYDNLKSVVINRKPQITYNPRFLEFCRHYGINIQLCNVACGNEKGRVERAIRTLRETFFNVNANHSSLVTINTALHQWLDKKNNTLHRVTQKPPMDLFREEKLRPLPNIAWNNINIYPPVKTGKTAMLTFDTNTYSVPDYLVGKSLAIHASPFRVEIYDSNKRVAAHPRSFDRYKQIVNPIHRSYQKLSTEAKKERIYQVINNMHPEMARFLKVNQTLGEDHYKTAYHIFKLLKDHSVAIIISALTESLNRKSPRLKTFLSYLNLAPKETPETVHPNNPDILNITYNPRDLDYYE
ncbi:MAG: IS21 family transposase [Candidatus Omnitrophota bacterium]